MADSRAYRYTDVADNRHSLTAFSTQIKIVFENSLSSFNFASSFFFYSRHFLRVFRPQIKGVLHYGLLAHVAIDSCELINQPANCFALIGQSIGILEKFANSIFRWSRFSWNDFYRKRNYSNLKPSFNLENFFIIFFIMKNTFKFYFFTDSSIVIICFCYKIIRIIAYSIC